MHRWQVVDGILTELDTWVVLADLVTLLVGEDHVGGEGALWRVWVCKTVSKVSTIGRTDRQTLLSLATLVSGLGRLSLGLGSLWHFDGW